MTTIEQVVIALAALGVDGWAGIAPQGDASMAGPIDGMPFATVTQGAMRRVDRFVQSVAIDILIVAPSTESAITISSGMDDIIDVVPCWHRLSGWGPRPRPEGGWVELGIRMEAYCG